MIVSPPSSGLFASVQSSTSTRMDGAVRDTVDFAVAFMFR